MKIVIESPYLKKPKEYPMNTREDLAEFLSEFPSATEAATSQGIGDVKLMAGLAAEYLSRHHLDVEVVDGDVTA